MIGYNTDVNSTSMMFPSFEKVDVADPFRETHFSWTYNVSAVFIG